MTVSPLLLGGAVTVVVLLGISAFFSSSEIAVFSLTPEWIDQQAAGGDKRAVRLGHLRENPHRLLVTLLVGNNIVNIAISSIVTVLLARYFSGGVAVLITTLLASSLVLVCGEIVPKSYGLGNAKQWALTVAGPIAVVEKVTYPLVIFFDVLTRRLGTALGGTEDIEQPYTDDRSNPSPPPERELE